MISATQRLAALLFAAAVGAAAPEAAAPLLPMRNPVAADAFTVRDLSGKAVSLGEFKGKVVLLNFWATWCAPCAKEMPSMERLYQAYRAKGLVIVGMSVDTSAPQEVKAFAQKLKITFPILHDRDSIVSRHYSIPGVPVSYLIDRKGRVAYRVLGEYDWFAPDAHEAVKALLLDEAH
jgi:peroxiredoxin